MDLNINELLSYPFDCETLFRKQRSIRKVLLEHNVKSIKKNIAILGGSTTSDIKNWLEIFLLHMGISPDFYESEYNAYYEDSMFQNKKLESFQPDFIFIFTSIVNLLYKPDLGDDNDLVKNKIEKEYARYESMWLNLNEKYGAIIIQNNIELPYSMPLGNKEASVNYGMQYFIERLNEKFSQYAIKHSGFYIHDIHYLSAQIGLLNWHNRLQYYAYKLAFNYDLIPLVAYNAAKLIRSILGKNKKCLILDLDNTLWGGVIGDVGVNNIQIGHEVAVAEAYTEFQHYVLELKQRGIILAVCSKNEMAIAKTGFDHPDTVLKVDDFFCFKANWRPKNLNIIEIAQEINIGLDSIVFIDDNPVERHLVREVLPEVAVPEIDSTDVFSYIRAIEGNGYFDSVTISKEDLNRNRSYIENKQRTEWGKNISSYDEFLRSLQMQAEISEFKEIYFERIAQLTNKTNQFNLTTKRYTLSDIKQINQNINYIKLYGRLKDRFGDNGLVSVLIGEKKEDELHIDLWLMSCRVLKRGMEYAMFDSLVETAYDAHIKKIVGYYYKTSKNEIVADLYKNFGFSLITINNEDTIWEINVTRDYKKKNSFISIGDNNV